jgi:hypothetical protein
MLLESFITMDDKTVDHIAAELKKTVDAGQKENGPEVSRDS